MEHIVSFCHSLFLSSSRFSLQKVGKLVHGVTEEMIDKSVSYTHTHTHTH